MGLALSLFLQSYGNYADRQLTKEKNEQARKEKERAEARDLREQYEQDLHHHSGVPDTGLGRWLLRNWFFITPQGRRAWLELWERGHYPREFYGEKERCVRELPPACVRTDC